MTPVTFSCDVDHVVGSPRKQDNQGYQKNMVQGAAKRIVAATNFTYSNGCGEVTIPERKYLRTYRQH